MLYRVVIFTRTTQNKKIFLLAFLVDLISIMTALLGIPIAIEMLNVCEISVATFTLLLDFYQFFAAFRMLMFFGHFLYGKRFWRWVKRQRCCCTDILNACEYEQRVEF